jgi:uncharacterized protein (TIGR03086 family)
MDPVERLEKATAHASKIVHGVGKEQLSDPTPCSEFTVKLLLNHMIGGLEMLRDAASGGTPQAPQGDQFGDDPAATYDERRAKLLEVVKQPGTLDKTWTMPFAPMPGQMMASIAFMEHVTHAWDLAKATGQDTTIPDELVRETFEVVTPMDAMLRMPGVCGPRIDVPDDASDQDKLIAFMGRQP